MTQSPKTLEFIKNARNKHKHKYYYPRTIYQGGHIKTIITCKKHGDFEQTPSSHLQGAGCAHCVNNVKKTNEEFVSEAKLIHGDEYQYDEVNYKGGKIKVKIKCKTHGPFYVIPANHLFKKVGCPDCSKANRGLKRRLCEKSFIKASQQHHGNRYDYSKVVYQKRIVPVIIICKIHGDFLQAPMQHMSGQGCPKCVPNAKKNLQSFIVNSNIKHGFKYQYHNVVLNNCKSKVIITCKKHGDFLQTPSQHLNGRGCPKCKESRGEMKIRIILEKKKLNFDFQKTFPNLKGQNYQFLKFDFYLPKFNLLIEYDGEAHYKLWNKFKNPKKILINTQRRDRIKTNYCRSRHINLLRIPYWDKHRIPELIDRKIQKIKQKALN